MSSDSSESSDDEVNLKIQEAVCNDFTNKLNKGLNQCEKEITNPQSIRNQIFIQTEQQKYELDVTPEFRKNAALKLSTYLDSIIDIINVVNQPRKHKDESGIFLIHRSNQLINSKHQDSNKHNSNRIKRKTKRKLPKCESSSDSDIEEKLRLSSVAVSGFEVLKNGEGAFTSMKKNKKLSNSIAENGYTKITKKKKKHKKKNSL